MTREPSPPPPLGSSAPVSAVRYFLAPQTTSGGCVLAASAASAEAAPPVWSPTIHGERCSRRGEMPDLLTTEVQSKSFSSSMSPRSSQSRGMLRTGSTSGGGTDMCSRNLSFCAASSTRSRQK